MTIIVLGDVFTACSACYENRLVHCSAMLYSYWCYVMMRFLQMTIISPVTVLGVKSWSHNITSIASYRNIHNIPSQSHDMLKFKLSSPVKKGESRQDIIQWLIRQDYGEGTKHAWHVWPKQQKIKKSILYIYCILYISIYIYMLYQILHWWLTVKVSSSIKMNLG